MNHTDNKTFNIDFARRLAEKHEQYSNDFFPTGEIEALKHYYSDPKIIEALGKVVHRSYNGIMLSDALTEQPEIFQAELVDAFKASENDGDYSKHFLNFIKYDKLTGNYEDQISKESKAILLLSQQQTEFSSLLIPILASIEARLLINQNLLMNVLMTKGFSEEEINELKKQNSESYKEYKEELTKLYAKKLEEFQNYSEDSESKEIKEQNLADGTI